MDIIKKLKIKKQDGTFSDYIPIGAEASNITRNNNENVEESFTYIENNKTKSYSNIENAKADLKLNNRD